MIPSPDFRVDVCITISEEVIKISCATIGFAICCWAIIKMTGILFGPKNGG